MILLPSPRHRKDGSPHDGGGEMPMCAAKHSLYCFFSFIGFHQEIGCLLMKVYKNQVKIKEDYKCQKIRCKMKSDTNFLKSY